MCVCQATGQTGTKKGIVDGSNMDFKRVRANEAMLLSNAKTIGLLSGSQLFNTKAASPSEKEADIGLYITFSTGE